MKFKVYGFSMLFCIFNMGCNSASLAIIDTAGLRYENVPISIDFTNQEKQSFINDNWLVENWQHGSGQWERKDGDEYRGVMLRDLDDDGNLEKEKVYFTELELRHQINDSKIYVDLAVLPNSKRNTKIDVFLSNFVEQLSGKTTWYKQSVYGKPENETRTYAAKIIEQQYLDKGNYSGILVTIELANLDQLKLDPNHRSEIVSVLLLRVDDYIGENVGYNDNGSYVFGDKRAAIFTTVLFSRPDDHLTSYKDFLSFIDSIKFRK
jgi:hypothetical protein